MRATSSVQVTPACSTYRVNTCRTISASKARTCTNRAASITEKKRRRHCASSCSPLPAELNFASRLVASWQFLVQVLLVEVLEPLPDCVIALLARRVLVAREDDV